VALEIAVSNFSFRYWKGAPAALDNVSLAIDPGSVCALLGPTNCGKTTLLQAVCGLLGTHHGGEEATGSIRLGADSFTPLPRNVLFPTTGLTLQEPYYQISGLRDSVFEEVALTLESMGLTDSEVTKRTTDLLEAIGLAHLARRKPSTLSGGELQRVALATILVARPPILLLDEPCNSLDGTAQRSLASIVCALKRNTTVIVADYQLDFAMLTADQFVVLDQGRVVFNGDRARFVESLSEFVGLMPVDLMMDTLGEIAASPHRRRIMKALGVQ